MRPVIGSATSTQRRVASVTVTIRTVAITISVRLKSSM
jgi:hypothetical protein